MCRYHRVWHSALPTSDRAACLAAGNRDLRVGRKAIRVGDELTPAQSDSHNGSRYPTLPVRCATKKPVYGGELITFCTAATISSGTAFMYSVTRSSSARVCLHTRPVSPLRFHPRGHTTPVCNHGRMLCRHPSDLCLITQWSGGDVSAECDFIWWCQLANQGGSISHALGMKTERGWLLGLHGDSHRDSLLCKALALGGKSHGKGPAHASSSVLPGPPEVCAGCSPGSASTVQWRGGDVAVDTHRRLCCRRRVLRRLHLRRGSGYRGLLRTPASS